METICARRRPSPTGSSRCSPAVGGRRPARWARSRAGAVPRIRGDTPGSSVPCRPSGRMIRALDLRGVRPAGHRPRRPHPGSGSWCSSTRRPSRAARTTGAGRRAVDQLVRAPGPPPVVQELLRGRHRQRRQDVGQPAGVVERWRTVIRRPPGTTPGSHRSTGSSSRRPALPTSCSTTAATNVLVMLPIRNRACRGTGRRLPTSASPLTPRQGPRSSWTCARAPTAPVATTSSSRRCSSVPGTSPVDAPAGRCAERRRHCRHRHCRRHQHRLLRLISDLPVERFRRDDAAGPRA